MQQTSMRAGFKLPRASAGTHKQSSRRQGAILLKGCAGSAPGSARLKAAPSMGRQAIGGTAMSFLFGTTPQALKEPERLAINGGESSDADAFYRDLIERRPALLDQKLKLHARIIDEFNLTALEKLPRAELVKQVTAYVANYVR